MRTIIATGACLLGIAGKSLGQLPPNYEIPTTPFPQQHFVSSNATGPVLQINKTGEPLDPGYLFFQPQLMTPALIMRDNGELIWSGPAEITTNPAPQTLFGKPVLTRWVGALAKGIGYGQVRILDQTYKQIYNICPKLGLYAPNLPVPPLCDADTHELFISNRNTVVITAWNVTQADLTSVGGPANGWVIDGQVYDIDIQTGNVVFNWSSIQHVPVNRTQNPINGTGTTPPNAFDFFHLNSVQPLTNGQYLVNSRFTSAMYLINTDGSIEWTFNGIDGGDFDLPAGGQFAFQHHARIREMTGDCVKITFFNNDNSEIRFGQDQSTGLEYELNTSTKSATLLRRLVDPNQPFYAIAQGSYVPLDNGNVLLDYGQEPVFKEYGPNGNSDVRMTIIFSNTTSNGTYRVYKSAWHGKPYYPPSLVVNITQAKAYASWNGATQVTKYRVNGGDTQHRLKKLAHVAKHGFETVIKLPASAAKLKYFQLVALEGDEKLGSSAIVQPVT